MRHALRLSTTMFAALALLAGLGLLSMDTPLNSAPQQDVPEPEDEPLDLDEESVARGKEKFETLCSVCHSVEGDVLIGEPVDEKWGTKVKLEEGDPVYYDEDFFRESIIDPAAKITKGYPNQMVPFILEDEEMDDLIAYVKSLGDPDKVRESEARMEKKMAEELAQKQKGKIRFLYGFCNDVKEMQEFYTNQLGMNETAFMDEEGFGWLVYKVEGMELMFFRWDEKLPVQENWAWQPGETIETAVPMMSFSIEFPMEKFRHVVKTLTGIEVTAQKPKPTWRQKSYWGWTVKDPMGNTIELYAIPKEKPEAEEPVWEDE